MMRALHETERKYLLDVARGLTAYEVAERHTVSINTVNSSLKKSKAALHARNICHAVTGGLGLGGVTLGEVAGATGPEGKYRACPRVPARPASPPLASGRAASSPARCW